MSNSRHSPDNAESRSRIYLDNAATSWPKPSAVYDAVDHYQRTIGAANGRGAYREARLAAELVASARRRVAELVGATRQDHVVFGLNGTDALNMAIHGLLGEVASGKPAHVVTTVAEHNSVLRPLAELERKGRAIVTYAPCDPSGVVRPEFVLDAIRDDTRLVALTHASNVTGAVQPAAEIGAIARKHGALFLLDAAQTLGEIDVNLDALNADLLAAPGHKGLLGPLGTGVLVIRQSAADLIQARRQGGTGSQSGSNSQPWELPDRLESGNLNMLGVAGLAASVDWLLRRGPDKVHSHAVALSKQLMEGLFELPNVRQYGPTSPLDRVGIVSFNVRGFDPQEVAAALDGVYGIQVRAGLHCAPRMHEALATMREGGTVRISHGTFNAIEEIDAVLAAIGELSASVF